MIRTIRITENLVLLLNDNVVKLFFSMKHDENFGRHILENYAPESGLLSSKVFGHDMFLH